MIQEKANLTSVVVIGDNGRALTLRHRTCTSLARTRYLIAECDEFGKMIGVENRFFVPMWKVWERLIDVSTLLHWRKEIECSFDMFPQTRAAWAAEENRLMRNLRAYVRRNLPNMNLRFVVQNDPRGPVLMVVTKDGAQFAMPRLLHLNPFSQPVWFEEEWL